MGERKAYLAVGTTAGSGIALRTPSVVIFRHYIVL